MPFLGAFGTIAVMGQHRVRLTDEEMSLVTSALRARCAALSGNRRTRIKRLLERLEEGRPGNPNWYFGWDEEYEGAEIRRLNPTKSVELAQPWQGLPWR